MPYLTFSRSFRSPVDPRCRSSLLLVIVMSGIGRVNDGRSRVEAWTTECMGLQVTCCFRQNVISVFSGYSPKLSYTVYTYTQQPCPGEAYQSSQRVSPMALTASDQQGFTTSRILDESSQSTSRPLRRISVANIVDYHREYLTRPQPSYNPPTVYVNGTSDQETKFV
jgi:hypothetical protein